MFEGGDDEERFGKERLRLTTSNTKLHPAAAGRIVDIIQEFNDLLRRRKLFQFLRNIRALPGKTRLIPILLSSFRCFFLFSGSPPALREEPPGDPRHTPSAEKPGPDPHPPTLQSWFPPAKAVRGSSRTLSKSLQIPGVFCSRGRKIGRAKNAKTTKGPRNSGKR